MKNFHSVPWEPTFCSVCQDGWFRSSWNKGQNVHWFQHWGWGFPLCLSCDFYSTKPQFFLPAWQRCFLSSGSGDGRTVNWIIVCCQIAAKRAWEYLHLFFFFFLLVIEKCWCTWSSCLIPILIAEESTAINTAQSRPYRSDLCSDGLSNESFSFL